MTTTDTITKMYLSLLLGMALTASIYFFAVCMEEDQEQTVSEEIQSIKHRYEMIYGAALTEDQKTIKNYIFSCVGSDKVLLLDPIEVLEQEVSHID